MANSITKIIMNTTTEVWQTLIRVAVAKYDSNELVVLKVDQTYYFPIYDPASETYIYVLDMSKLPQTNAGNLTVRAILYDFNHETFVDARWGDFKNSDLDLSSTVYASYSIPLVPGASELTTTVWQPLGLEVTAVEGPFQDNKLVKIIDLSKKVYYLATFNNPDLTDSQMLCTHWEYQYNSDKVNSFKNSVRSIVTDNNVRKCKMVCEFKNDPSTITVAVYASTDSRNWEWNHCPTTYAIGGEPKECRITLKEIEDLFGVYSKHKAFRQEIIDYLNKYIYDSGKEIHINTKLRKAHFFAQVGVETLRIHPNWIEENDGNFYRIDIARQKFGDRAKKLDAQGKLTSYIAQRPQIKLLNFVYAKENGFGNGNGNEQSGDGYRYRGRGLFQTTGRGNYRAAADRVKEYFPDDYVDYEEFPEKLKEPKHAVLSAIAFWEKKKIWDLADKLPNPTEQEFKSIRKMVNSGLSDWKIAHEHMKKGLTIFEEKCSGGSINSGQTANSEPGVFNAKDVITYKIYSTGKIEKHIPKKIKEEYKQSYKYVYVDGAVEHEVCTIPWHTTSKKLPSDKKLYSKPTHSKVLTDEKVNEGQTKRRVKYKNGDIAEYGYNDGDTFWRLYKATSETVQLVKMPENAKYVKYNFTNTQRRYTGPDYYAGFVGALGKTGFNMQTTGSCFKEGSCFPSQFHVNGESVDTIYFGKDSKTQTSESLKKDQAFIDAMKLFNFKEAKVGNDKYFKGLTGTVDGGNLHDSHLHSGLFDSSKIIKINEP